MRIGFVGAGRVATALARSLAARGYAVTAVASRGGRSAQRLAGQIPPCVAVPTAQAVVEQADLVFLAVPDDVVGPLASSLRWRSEVAAVHCSGALELDVLRPATASGARIGSFHPLQTFPDVEGALRHLPDSAIAVEGDERLLVDLEELARAVGGWPIRLPPGSKALYHASATLACASVVTLVGEAATLWSHFGYPPDEALAALLPLLRGTVAALEQASPAQALTGPMARGDVGTVRRHLDALQARVARLLPLYCLLGLHTVRLAEEKGTLGASQAGQLRDILRAGAARKENDECV